MRERAEGLIEVLIIAAVAGVLVITALAAVASSQKTTNADQGRQEVTDAVNAVQADVEAITAYDPSARQKLIQAAQTQAVSYVTSSQKIAPNSSPTPLAIAVQTTPGGSGAGATFTVTVRANGMRAQSKVPFASPLPSPGGTPVGAPNPGN